MHPCQCKEEGFCQRYQRDMRGRWWEICQGINVDLGTSVAFRNQWEREAAPKSALDPARRLLLKTNQAPGDALVMTAAIYSLHKAYPGKYTTAVQSPYPEVFEHNPSVVPQTAGVQSFEMHYPAVKDCNSRGIHFMQGWCEFLGEVLDVSIPLLTNRPRLYFNTPSPPTEDYWVVCSGGKTDFTTKLWGRENYQAVIHLLPEIPFVQVGGAADDHPRLEGVTDKVGHTTLRGLFELVRRCKGVLCGISLLMHVAAALEKPCIVIAGGREPVQWNSYPKQHYVHTVGALGCTPIRGGVGQACWRHRTVPLGDHIYLDQNTCQRPIDGTPKCMRLISPEHVANLVMLYNDM